MGNFQRRDGSFGAFRNEYKKEAKHPDFKGRMSLGGVEYDVALWKKKKDDGEVYLSGSISPARERPQKPERRDSDDSW